MTRYIYQYYLFAPSAAVMGIRQLLALEFGLQAFNEVTTALSAASDPTGPIVGYCGSIPATEEQRQGLSAFENAGGINGIGVYYCRCDALTGEVKATNFPGAQDRIGRIWDTTTALELIGLTFHRPAQVTP